MCFFNNTLHCSVKICLFFFFNFCYPSSQTHWISRDVHRLQIKECYHIDAGSLLAKMTMCSSSIWSPPLAPNFRVKSEILSMTHRPYYNPSRLSFSCFPALYLKLRRYWIANSSLNEQCCLALGIFRQWAPARASSASLSAILPGRLFIILWVSDSSPSQTEPALPLPWASTDPTHPVTFS